MRVDSTRQRAERFLLPAPVVPHVAYDAVIFDNDGVLVELVDLTRLREAAVRTFDELGVDADPDHVDEIVVGVTPDLLTDICDPYGLDHETFWSTRDRVTAEFQCELVRDGVTCLYDDFHAVEALDAPLGIVSSNQQRTIDFMHEFFGTRALFETVYGREPTVESLHRKKPDPHYVERALSDLGVDSALFVGDSESDVLAAHRAGLDSAFLRRSHRADLELSVTPTYELEGLSDLLDVDGVPTGADRGRAGADVAE